MEGVETWDSPSTLRTPNFPALNTDIDYFNPHGGLLSSLDSPDSCILHGAPLLDQHLTKSTGFLTDSTLFDSTAIDPAEAAFMAGENEISQAELDNLAQWIPQLAGAGGGPQPPIDEIAAELQSLDAKQFLLQQQMTHVAAAAAAASGGSLPIRDGETDLYAAFVQQQLQVAAEMHRDGPTAAAAAFQGRKDEGFGAELSPMAGFPGNSTSGGNFGATNAPRPRRAAAEPLSALGMIETNSAAAGRSNALEIRPASPPQSTAQFSRAANQLAIGNAPGASTQWPPSEASAGVQIGANWLQNQPQQLRIEPTPAQEVGGIPADELEALFQQIPADLAPEERIVLAAALMAEVQRNNAATLGGVGHSQHSQRHQPQHQQHSSGRAANASGIAFAPTPVVGNLAVNAAAIPGGQPSAFAEEPQQRLLSTRLQPETRFNDPASLQGFPEFPADFQDIAQCMSGRVSSEAFGASESSAERVASAPGGGGMASGSRGEPGASGAGRGGGGASGGNAALKAIRPRSVKERRRRERISDCLRRLKTAIPQEILGDRQDLGSMIEKSVSYIHTLQARLDSLESSDKGKGRKDEEI
ncbi:hypothetical protein CLOM_g6801 [Closterium sp. NIES-68]|nr:hypothetical protein CLOM_g6801 [Closterium sp. NIES-68]GJP72336.1 hypothetical protein CLOP_g3078 [Closterium sp. NIES-67]